MKPTYTEVITEFNKLSMEAIGETHLELSIDLIKKISSHEKLKNALFKITLFKEADRYNMLKHIFVITNGENIISILNEYKNGEYKFTFAPLEDN